MFVAVLLGNSISDHINVVGWMDRPSVARFICVIVFPLFSHFHVHHSVQRLCLSTPFKLSTSATFYIVMQNFLFWGRSLLKWLGYGDVEIAPIICATFRINIKLAVNILMCMKYEGSIEYGH